MVKQIKQYTQAEKRSIVQEHLRIAPELSNRQIAKIIGVSPTTVGTIRQELIAENEQFGHRHTQDDWTKHPYFIANKEKLLSKGLSKKSLIALRNRAVLDKMSEINSLSPRYAQRLLYKEKKAANKKAVNISENDVRVFQADVRTGIPEIATGSVQLCFVDMPYHKKAIEELTPHIATTSARILSEGSSLLLMVGGSHLDIVLNKLTNTADKILKFQWDICYICPRGTPLIQGRRVTTAVKHIIWMVKGKYEGDIKYDLIYAPEDTEGTDKTSHPWGQSVEGVKSILSKWTVEGDTICDFMCGWSSSTAQAALELGGRKLILSDIDPLAVKTTKNIVNTMFGAK